MTIRPLPRSREPPDAVLSIWWHVLGLRCIEGTNSVAYESKMVFCKNSGDRYILHRSRSRWGAPRGRAVPILSLFIPFNHAAHETAMQLWRR
jgi:hypothetical protein